MGIAFKATLVTYFPPLSCTSHCPHNTPTEGHQLATTCVTQESLGDILYSSHNIHLWFHASTLHCKPPNFDSKWSVNTVFTVIFAHRCSHSHRAHIAHFASGTLVSMNHCFSLNLFTSKQTPPSVSQKCTPRRKGSLTYRWLIPTFQAQIPRVSFPH